MCAIKLQLLIALAYSAIRVSAQDQPVCYLCGDADASFENPTAVVPLPDDLQAQVPPGLIVTCDLLEQLALGGLVEPDICSAAQAEPQLAEL